MEFFYAFFCHTAIDSRNKVIRSLNNSGQLGPGRFTLESLIFLKKAELHEKNSIELRTVPTNTEVFLCGL